MRGVQQGGYSMLLTESCCLPANARGLGRLINIRLAAPAPRRTLHNCQATRRSGYHGLQDLQLETIWHITNQLHAAMCCAVPCRAGQASVCLMLRPSLLLLLSPLVSTWWRES